MTHHSFSLTVITISVVLFASVAAIQAARIDTGELEQLLDKYGIEKSDGADIVRSFRGAVNVGVDQRKLRSIIGHALESDMRIKLLIRALTLVTNVALDGLPSGPMLNKFSEGLAKRVDDDDIVDALEKEPFP